MYEYLAKRPVLEKKDPRPSSRARYLNAADKSGEEKFSLSNARVQYDPQKTAQLKAHAFTESSAAPKMSTPRGVIQCAFWIFKKNDRKWRLISGKPKPPPTLRHPVNGMIFDDITRKRYSPGQKGYRIVFNAFMRRRSTRAKLGIYKNRLSAFAKKPHRIELKTPFDKKKPYYSKAYGIKRRGQTSYLASAKGMGKRKGNRRGSIAYDDVSDRRYPKGVFSHMREDLLAKPNAPVRAFNGNLTDEQGARLAGLEAIQHVEEWRAPTGGTLPAMFLGYAEDHSYDKAKALYPLAPDGGTQATRDMLSGKTDFTQGQADAFFEYAPPSPPPPKKYDDGGFTFN